MTDQGQFPIVALVDELKEQINEISTDPMFRIKGAQIRVKFQVSNSNSVAGGFKLMVVTADTSLDRSQIVAHEIVLDLLPINEGQTLGD